MSKDPNSHTSNHQSSIEAIEPWFRGDKISIPPLREFNHTINRTEDNGDVGDDDGGDEELEFGGFGEGGGDAGETGVTPGAVPEVQCCDGEDDVASALDYDTGFLE
jgi:hypothetical protein